MFVCVCAAPEDGEGQLSQLSEGGDGGLTEEAGGGTMDLHGGSSLPLT